MLNGTRLRRECRRLKPAEPEVLHHSRHRRGGRRLKHAEPEVLNRLNYHLAQSFR